MGLRSRARLLMRFVGRGEEPHPSAPSKAFNPLGASPDQGNVTALYPTVVTAFP